MALTMPKFIVLKPSDNNGYLSYIREGENNIGCQNKKYSQRTKTVSIAGVPPGQYWITATAQNKEEDQSKETCTLFKFVPVDHATGTSLLVLPRYVVFKGHNNKYLCVRENYSAFSADEIGDSTVACVRLLLLMMERFTSNPFVLESFGGPTRNGFG
ncbi:Agglutinin [Gossypium australe]|uniref:Agglutinin n=1 Tax=Gossypium australe TaxID=47621 RepID=A0A5B6WXB7_9ROSI|nr:Agglutinin [Gossypium australe]